MTKEERFEELIERYLMSIHIVASGCTEKGGKMISTAYNYIKEFVDENPEFKDRLPESIKQRT